MPTQKRKSDGKSVTQPVIRKSASVKKVPASRMLRPALPTVNSDVLALRKGFGLSRKVFSRLSQFSERAIADWESGESLGVASRQRMTELQRLQQALGRIMEPDYIGEWLQTPQESFDGLKPLEVIERGQIDRIWRMIHLMESGVPS